MIEANGVEICTEAFGDPKDPALLLIIGAGASMLRWDDALIQRLVAAERYVVRFDNRDTGRTTTYPLGEPPYTLADMAADAVAVLNAYEIDKAHVLGRSMGGMIAQHVVLDYPERVLSATLIYSTPSNSIAGGPPDELPGQADELVAANAEAAGTDGDEAEQQRRRIKVQQILHGSAFPFDAEKAGALFERERARARDHAVSGNHAVAIRNSAPWRHRLAEIETPTLIVHGTEDPILQIAHGEALAAEIRGADVMWMEGVGHALPQEIWDTLVPRLLAHTAAKPLA